MVAGIFCCDRRDPLSLLYNSKKNSRRSVSIRESQKKKESSNFGNPSFLRFSFSEKKVFE